VVEAVVEAFVNVAQYQPFHGGSYMPLPKKLQNKKSNHHCPKTETTSA